jgi:N-acetylglucosamine-6-phosphate deacetylase
MSPLENRTPGLVGAAINLGSLYAGIIADGFHVHPASMSIALRAKQGPGKIFIVSDAMSTIGTDLTGLMLNGRQIYRKDGRLTLADGTLAGADIDMLSSVRFIHEKIGLPFEEAVRMASLYPAEAIGVADRKGQLKPGMDADFVVLTKDHAMQATWIGGKQVYAA